MILRVAILFGRNECQLGVSYRPERSARRRFRCQIFVALRRFVAEVQEPGPFAAADRLLELSHRFGLDVTHRLAGHAKDFVHFFRLVRATVHQPVTQTLNLAFAVVQVVQHVGSQTVNKQEISRKDAKVLKK
jgi:hypothetical protein